MAILTIVVALALPSLSGFFRGRNQQAEVERLLALTRLGRSRAVTEGIPMVLWIDPRTSSYGLREEVGYTDGDRKARQFTLDSSLKIDVALGAKGRRVRGSLSAIYFSPTGEISPDSVSGVVIEGPDGSRNWIVQSGDGFGYEVQTQLANVAYRR
jgi:Tfp pilus assembly protein FimT